MPITKFLHNLCCTQIIEDEVEGVSYHRQTDHKDRRVVEGVDNASFIGQKTPHKSSSEHQSSPEEKPTVGLSSFGISKKECFHNVFDHTKTFESVDEMNQFLKHVEKSVSPDDEAFRFNTLPKVRTQEERVSRIVINVNNRSDNASVKDSKQPQKCPCRDKSVKLSVLLPSLCCNETKEVQFFASTTVKTKAHISNLEDASRALDACAQDAGRFFEAFNMDKTCQGNCGNKKFSIIANKFLNAHKQEKTEQTNKTDDVKASRDLKTSK